MAETTTRFLSPVGADSLGNPVPVRVSGFLTTLHLAGALPAAPGKQIGGCWSPGACLCWDSDPGMPTAPMPG